MRGFLHLNLHVLRASLIIFLQETCPWRAVRARGTVFHKLSDPYHHHALRSSCAKWTARSRSHSIVTNAEEPPLGTLVELDPVLTLGDFNTQQQLFLFVCLLTY